MSRKRAVARSYIKMGQGHLEEYLDKISEAKRMGIEEGLIDLELFANTERPELVNVGQGTYQVWIRKDRESCFRAHRATYRS